MLWTKSLPKGGEAEVTLTESLYNTGNVYLLSIFFYIFLY